MLNSCSKEVQKSVKWLENKLNNENEPISRISDYIEAIYALFMFKHENYQVFLNKFLEKKVWNKFRIKKHAYLLYYLAKLGLTEEVHFQNKYLEMKKLVTTEGRISTEGIDQTGPMRVFTIVEPEKKEAILSLKFFISNFENFLNEFPIHLRIFERLPVGIFTLYEVDMFSYKIQIDQALDHFKKLMENQNYFTQGRDDEIENEELNILFDNIVLLLSAFAMIRGRSNVLNSLGTEWIMAQQNENDSWFESVHSTFLVLNYLYYIGEGPKISQDEFERLKNKHKQEIRQIKSKINNLDYISNLENKIKRINEILYLDAEKYARRYYFIIRLIPSVILFIIALFVFLFDPNSFGNFAGWISIISFTLFLGALTTERPYQSRREKKTLSLYTKNQKKYDLNAEEVDNKF